MTITITRDEVEAGLNLVRDNFPTLTGAPDPEKDDDNCAYSTLDGTAWCVIGRLCDLWGFRLPKPEDTANVENVTTLFKRFYPHVRVEPSAMALMEKAQTLNDEVIEKRILTRRTMKEVVDICLPPKPKYANW